MTPLGVLGRKVEAETRVIANWAHRSPDEDSVVSDHTLLEVTYGLLGESWTPWSTIDTGIMQGLDTWLGSFHSSQTWKELGSCG